MNKMINNGVERIELPSSDGETCTILELYQIDKGDTEESIREWCDEQSTWCQCEGDCCGRWYNTMYLLCIDKEYGVFLAETHAYINV
jgi:hypothetical protein